jgi:hypothetical protein
MKRSVIADPMRSALACWVALITCGAPGFAAIVAPAAVPTAAPSAAAADFVVRDATVYTESPAGVLQHTDVWVHAGAIAGIGHALAVPAGAEVIDAHGRPLTPGLFGGLSDVGIDEVSEEPDTLDSTQNAKAPAWDQQWRPEFDVTAAYNPRSVFVPVTRIEGVTWTVLAPSSGDAIIGGQGAAVTLDGRFGAVLDGSASLFVQLGHDGAKRAGGTRAAESMLLDQAVSEARGHAPPGPGSLLHAAGRETLARYLGGGRVLFQVDRAADILRAVDFARRNGMHPVIVGGDEAWVVAHELAAAGVPVILNPLDDLPEDFDRLAATLDNAARLHQAGVRIAFTSGDTQYARIIRQLAGNAVAHGLPWDAALAAITSTPADIFGVGTIRGRIATGRSADVVLWSGDPLEVTTLADRVWIDGRAIELHSRQTELRDRYLGRLKPH